MKEILLDKYNNTTEIPSPKEVINHFYDNIVPKIEDDYNSIKSRSKRSIARLLSNKNKDSNDVIKDDLGIEVAKGLFEFVVGDDIDDKIRINLFTDVLYLYTSEGAYANLCLDFYNYANILEKKGHAKKSKIIRDALEIGDVLYWKLATTITFGEKTLTIENGYGKYECKRDDLLKNLNG